MLKKIIYIFKKIYISFSLLHIITAYIIIIKLRFGPLRVYINKNRQYIIIIINIRLNIMFIEFYNTHVPILNRLGYAFKC